MLDSSNLCRYMLFKSLRVSFTQTTISLFFLEEGGRGICFALGGNVIEDRSSLEGAVVQVYWMLDSTNICRYIHFKSFRVLIEIRKC